MLALLGAATVLVLLATIMLNLLSPLVALIGVPIVAALVGGFGLGVSKMIVTGISSISSVAGMFVFAILFFGIMTDAGLLDPVIARILRVVGVRPTRIVVGTALLALLIHLDGSGAVCFLITIPAMLPLYDGLGMDRRVLACAASLAAGVNFLPWTGPTLRASAALKIPVAEIFNPMIGVQVVGLIFVFAACWWLGKREERRLGLTGAGASAAEFRGPVAPELTPEQRRLRRPHLFWVNLALTVAVMAVMIGGWVDPVVMFMVGVVLALVVNYGRACATGAAAARTDAAVIAFVDGDGSDRVELAGEVIGPVLAGRADLVLGSRLRGPREPGSLGAAQVAAGRIAGSMLQALYGLRSTDMGPFRAIARPALDGLGMREMSFGWNVEMQMRAAAAGLRIEEVAVGCRRRVGGVSKVSGRLGPTLRASAVLVRTVLRLAVALRRTGRQADR